jgi:hypothetical protein
MSRFLSNELADRHTSYLGECTPASWQLLILFAQPGSCCSCFLVQRVGLKACYAIRLTLTLCCTLTSASRALQVSMQQSATDARTGMIDMDKIFSGVGAIDRETRKHLAVMIAELLVSAPPRPPCHACSV